MTICHICLKLLPGRHSTTELVLCKDCLQWDEEGGMMGRGWCGYQMKCTGPHYFCADGEKETEEDDAAKG